MRPTLAKIHFIYRWSQFVNVFSLFHSYGHTASFRHFRVFCAQKWLKCFGPLVPEKRFEESRQGTPAISVVFLLAFIPKTSYCVNFGLNWPNWECLGTSFVEGQSTDFFLSILIYNKPKYVMCLFITKSHVLRYYVLSCLVI